MVAVDQRHQSGAWVKLGSFAFEAGDYRVELSDQASGLVTADAVYVVPTPVGDPDSYTWTPTIAATADYQVYARWTAGPDRAANAEYVVETPGGLDLVTVSQRPSMIRKSGFAFPDHAQPVESEQDSRIGSLRSDPILLRRGGAWNLLGTFALEAGTGNRIVLNAATADGTLVADAIRIVRAVAAGEIAYVHADHLGQPQKLTDAGATLLWDRVALPYGATHSEAGLGETALRFPGQWADAESGLHYNYFRDYDPSLGRYIESDPIGLAGGLNTYGYVGGNPVRWTDPLGLEVQICCRPAEIAGGIIDHCWIQTDTKSAGMGANPNIPPGQQYEGYGMSVQITDHSKDTPTQCMPQNNVDEQCVNDKLQIGESIGRFLPPFNQCQSFAYGIVNSCRTGPQMTPRP